MTNGRQFRREDLCSGRRPFRYFVSWLVALVALGVVLEGFYPITSTPTTIPAGSYIIDMGVSPQTVANGLKPYGMVYELIATRRIPVLWAINDTKVKDAVDFVFNGKSYRGGPFIISAEYASAAAATVATWRALGVVVDGPTAAAFTAPVAETLTSWPRVALDSANGSLAVPYYTNAGIPSTSYRSTLPGGLTACDDLYVMPHADPTWTTHNQLLAFNNGGGSIWAACHSVSVLENVDSPLDADTLPNLNFLSTTGLVPYGSHADGSPPFTYRTTLGYDPIMQFLGILDSATTNGSEQIYLPRLGGGWRPTSAVLAWDATQANVPSLSPGEAAVLVYGRGFGVPTNGYVMYEGGHQHTRGSVVDNVAAQRAFFNLHLITGLERRPDITASVPAALETGATVNVSAAVTGGTPGYSFQWTSSCGGTFAAPTAASTTFTAPAVAAATPCILRVVVTDSCNRVSFDARPVQILPVADVAVTKTDGTTSVISGGSTTYLIVVTNVGPSAAGGAVVTDPAAAGLTKTGLTCSASGGAVCPASPTPAQLEAGLTIATLPSGGSVTFTLTAAVTASSGTVANAVSVALPAAISDPTPGNNSATDVDVVIAQADLSITKTDGVASAVPGTPLTYTVVATNAGPTPVVGATVTDVLPAALVAPTWTCVGAGGGVCPPGGSGNIGATVNLPVGATVTFTVSATVAPDAGGSLSNTALVAPPAGITDPNAANNSATDTDTLTPEADLRITKTDGVASVVPGTSVTYTITATNAGPSSVTGATVADAFPAALTGVAWTCTASAGSACPASGSDSIGASVDLLAGGSATFTVTGTVSASAAGTLVNTATVAPPPGVTDPTPGNNSATDTDTLSQQADLQISKSDGLTTAVPGTAITYAVVVTNAGPGAVTAAPVTDTFPASFTSPTWTCTAGGGGSCGSAAGSGSINATVTLPVGATATFTVTGTVSPTANGTLANTATVAPPPGVTDPTPGNNSATDTDTLTPQADLTVTKTDGAPFEVPGTLVTYTLVATNVGPSAVTGATVSDALPAELTGATWTCTASFGSACPASGSGSIAASVDLAPGGAATFTLTATVSSTATGTLANTATVSAPPGVTDPTPANNSATDIDTLTPQADLQITKTDGVPTAVPGSGLTYTIVVSNAGPSAVTGAAIADSFPAALTGVTWTCLAAGGASCTASGSGAIADLVSLPAGATLTYTATGTVSTTAAGTLVNTATVTAPAGVTDPTPGNNSATDTDALAPQADLSITKTDGSTTAVPGQLVTYTVVGTNTGPSAVNGATVTDTFPAALTGIAWTCVGAGGGVCPAGGSGNLAAAVDLPVGATVTFTVTATVSASATGSMANTATIVPPGAVTDPTPGNNSATDTDSLTPQADLSITKTDGVTTVTPGTSVTYTIVVGNAGPSVAAGATVADTFPLELVGATWTCVDSGGGACGTASGSGSIATTVTLPVGGTATFTVTGTISAAASGAISNTATVGAPPGVIDPTPANNSATDTDTLTGQADLAITKTDGVTVAVPGQPVTYTIVATNNGPSVVVGATLTDTFQASYTAVTWTCVASAGSVCPASGSGSIGASVNLLVGGTATFTVTGTVSASATGTIANTATIAAPAGVTDPVPANDSATDTDTLTPRADVRVTKSAAPSPYVPGAPLTYTLVVTNAGPSVAPATSVTDPLPPAFAGFTWTCAASGGSACAAASGSGSISTTVDLAVGGTATFTVTGTVPPGTTGAQDNTVTVTPAPGITDPVPGNNAASNTNPVGPRADLQISKSSSPSPYVPGLPITYTIIAGNLGPSGVTGAHVQDVIPGVLTGATWTCSAAAGAACGTATGSGAIDALVDLAVGATATFTVTATVPPSLTGVLTNTATIAPPAGTTDPVAGNNAATDANNAGIQADLSVTKTATPAVYVPDAAFTYTVVVTNAGPSAATDARVQDTLPPALAGFTWTCAGGGGATCGTVSGAGDIDALVSLPVSGTATFTVTGIVPAATVGPLVNTATVAAPPGGADPDPSDNTAVHTSSATTDRDLAIVKTIAPAAYVPGQTVTYTIVVTSVNPPRGVTNALVQDAFPGVLGTPTWTCAAVNGASCGTAAGTGDISALVSLPNNASGRVTFTVTAVVPSGASGLLTNTATVTPPVGTSDTNTANNSSTVSAPAAPSADLAITKSDAVTTAVPGQPLSYTIVVTNAGPSDAIGTTVADTFPAAFVTPTWTCLAAAGASCPAAGSGNISATVNVPVGGSVTFTVSGTVAAGATGTLVNTATVTAPGGVTDPTPGNNSATDTDTLTPRADLTISKTDGVTTAVPGQTVTYTIVATNLGPGAAPGATVTDTFPGTLTGVTWTCVGAGGGTCSASGAGSVNETVGLPVGASVTFTVTGTVSSTATGTLANTATVIAPGGVTDPTPGNNSATDTDTLTSQADLGVTKTDDAPAAVPGQSLTYTIVARNAGPSAVTGATVIDAFPAALTGISWTCAATVGSTCPASGGGALSAAVSLLVGGTATFTVTGTVSATATGTLANTVSLTPPAGTMDPNAANDTATDVDVLTPQADLAIAKSATPGAYVPGQTLTYTVTVSNAGPSVVTGARVQDALPAAVSAFSWTCSSAAGACGTPTGTGNIDVLVDLPVGATAVFTVTGTVPSSTTGTLTNTAAVAPPAGVTDPAPANNSAGVSTPDDPRADLAILKSVTPNPYVPGATLTYTLVASNLGPSDVVNARVQDSLPIVLPGFTWTCISAGGLCGTAAGTGSVDATVSLPVGATATFTVTGTVAATATGTLANTASITPPTGVTDAVAANNTSSISAPAAPLADLSVSKISSPVSFVPGAPLTYTIVAANLGPSVALGARVQDTLPLALAGFTWSCAAGGGGTCRTASGTGAIDALVDLPVGGTATFTLTGTVPPGLAGALVNTATIAPPSGTTDPVAANNSATDSNTGAGQADLAIAKTATPDPYVPGAPLSYTIVATNLGPSNVIGASVADTLPGPLAAFTWTCAGAAGGSCQTASGTGSIAALVDLPVGGTATFTVTGTVASSVTGALANTATILPPAGVTDPVTGNNTSSVSTPAGPRADIAVSKSGAPNPYVPGLPLTYTVVVTNLGPSDAAGVRLQDPLAVPVAGFSWTCTAVAGGACAAASGSGDIDTLLALPRGASVTFTITGTVPPGTTGALDNTATATAPAGVIDPVPGNNAASISNPVGPQADLLVTKSSTPNPYVPGSPLLYTVTVSNAGPGNVTGARVQDALPASLAGFTWTCSAGGGAVCVPSGTGSLDTLVDLPVGASATFAFTGTVPPATTGALVNTATIAAPAGVTDPVPGNNAATDNNNANVVADLGITKASTPNPYVPGTPLTYTIVVTNAGPSDVGGARVQDSLPAPLAAFTWTCAAAGTGAACNTASGSGGIDALVALPVGTTATFTVTGVVPPGTTGPLVNTATVAAPAGTTDPVPGDNQATDTNNGNVVVDLAVTKAASPSPYVPGTALSYTVTVTNAGPSDVTAARLLDALPPPLAGFSWSCAGAGGATCATALGLGDVNVLVSVPVGGTISVVVSGVVPPGAMGTLSNTASIAPPSGVTDAVPSNNSASTATPANPVADLSVVKSASPSPFVPGTPLIYTLLVSNAGPSMAVGARVLDTLPAGLSTFAWACTASAGSSCATPAGTGDIDALVTLSVGGTATFTVTGIVPPSLSTPLVNTAVVTAPPGTTDPVSANNLSRITTVSAPLADLSIAKSSSSNPYVPGTPLTYTVTAVNAGPSAVVDALVQDTLPAPLSGFSWICAGTGGASCATAAGAGDVSSLVSIPVGATVTFTITGTVPSSTTATLVNTATIAPPAGTTDPVAANNTSTDANAPALRADLAVTKSSAPNPYVPGLPLSYTIVVANHGPSDVAGARLLDPLPLPIAGFAWTCTPTGTGASCGTAIGTGNLDVLLTLPAATSATFTVTGTVPAGTTGTLFNTATVIAPAGVTDTVPGNNSASDVNDSNPLADLVVTKSGSPSPYVPGAPLTYTVVVTNLGPSVALGATVTDPLPSAFAAFTWTCAASAGSTCPAAGGPGAVSARVDLLVGGTATFTVAGTVPSGTTGAQNNAVTVTPPAGVADPVPGNNTASNTNPVGPVSDLRITKSSSPSPYVPGLPLTSTITVTNAGPSDVVNARVQDALPAALSGFNWTCSSAGGLCGAASGTGDIDALVSLPSGASATFTLTGTISAGQTGPIVNTATVALPLGVTDPVPGDNAAMDANNANVTADLAITKTSAPASYVPGLPLTYTIVVTNNGPSNATLARVQDALPPGLAGFSWTCASGLGLCNTASGSGDIDALVSLPSGAAATFTVTGTVPAGQIGVLTNTATVAAPAGVNDPVSGNNQATDNNQPNALADLQVTKSSAPNPYVPGLPLTYTVVVTNLGPSNATNARLQDSLPVALGAFSWTCTGAGGGSCGAPSGVGDIDALVTLPVGATATFTVTGLVPPALTGTLTNVATVSTPAGVNDPVPANNDATDLNTGTPIADLSVTKTDGVTTAVPGRPLTYTIVVTNAGPSYVPAAPVTDAVPAALVSPIWTCVATSGSACAVAGGAGSIATTVNLAPGGTATFSVTGTLAANATGTLVNTATVAPPPTVADPVPANNSATDTDTLSPEADLSVTKTDNQTAAVPGQTITYTIVATNLGPSAVTGATVSDTMPATLAGATWTCVASAGSSCPASGAGNIGALVNLTAGGTATFTVTGTVQSTATGTISNTAAVTAPAGVTDPTPANNSATDVDTLSPVADLVVSKSGAPSPYVPGLPLTYTIVVTNLGPSVAVGATVVDPFPAAFAGFTWTCVPSAGSGCGAASGAVGLNTSVTLAVAGTATFTVTGTVPPATVGAQNNAVAVAPAAGTLDPVPGNNTDAVTNPVGPVSDLRIAKSSSPNPYVPGAAVVYTVVATNVGPSNVFGARVQDTLPVGVSGATWTCVGVAGGVCGTSTGTGNLDTVVDLPVGATATFVVSATTASSLTGVLTNAATITPPVGTTDPVPGDNQAFDNNNASLQADLSVTKVSTPNPYVPGTPLTYTMIVTNAGPSDVVNARVQDALPPEIVGFTWTCASAGGACNTASGTGDIDALVSLPSGASATFTLGGTVPPSASAAIVNTVTVAAPAGVLDPVAANNGATDVNTPDPRSDLAIVKTASPSPHVPGLPLAYTLVVTNAGPSDAVNARIQDAVPATLTGVTWTCVAGGGAACASASGAGNVDLLANVSVGATVTVVVTTTVPSTQAGPLTNSATVTPAAGVTDPNPSNNLSQAVTTSAPQADLQITKSATPSPAVPGTPLSFTITATNAGPSAVVGALVSDALAGPLVGFTWSCAGACTPAAGTGSVSTLVDLSPGASATITVTGTLPSSATGPLVNTATISAPAGTADPIPGNNAATVSVPVAVRADLAITKTSTPNPYVAGLPLTYTITVSNQGPSDVSGARVQDTLPGALAAFTWTCGGSGGAACATAAGSGNIDALVSVPVGATAVFTVTGTVPASTAGQLVNTATVAAPAGVIDPAPGNNTASDANPTNNQADLVISKSSTPDPYVPGLPLTYTIVVSNLGPSDAIDTRVLDALPAPLSGFAWTCAGTGGGVCVNGVGAGDINAIVDLPAGTSVTFTVTGTVPPGTTGQLVNIATVVPRAGLTDPVPGNNVATDTNPTNIVADLAVTKTSAPSPYVPGLPLTYTIVVNNFGPSNVVDARVQDALPAAVRAFTWTCAASTGATCGTAAGAGSVDALVSLAVGHTVTFTISGVVPAGAVGQLTNTATVAAPPGVTDPVPGNNEASDANPTSPVAELSITKMSTPIAYVPGSVLTYTIVVSNAGPSTAANARVRDVLPAPLSGFTWTCSTAGGGVCGTLAGVGDIDALVTLPPSTSVTFTVTGVVPLTSVGTLTNTATVTPPVDVTDPTPTNESTNENRPLQTPAGLDADVCLAQTYPPTATAGGLITFTYTATNRGPGAALDLFIDGMIPAGTTFVSATPSAGGVVSIVNGMIVATWPGLTFPGPGNDRTVTITLRVDPAAAPGTVVWNWFMTDSRTPDPYHFNNMVDSYVVVTGSAVRADVVLSGVASASGLTASAVPVRVGQEARVRVTARNTGAVTARAQYALILDEMPAVEITSASASQGWLGVSGPSSGVWETGDLVPGGTASLDLGLRMRDARAVKLLVARVDGSPADPDATNDIVEVVLDGIGAAPHSGREVATGNVLTASAGGEIVVVAGTGESPQVHVYAADGTPALPPFFAFDRPFLGGVALASCDVDADGVDEIVAAQKSAGSVVRVLRLVSGVVTQVTAFQPFEAGFTGGVSVACTDVDGDGRGDIAAGAGPGRAPEVRVFAIGAGTATQTAAFTAYEPAFAGGVRVSAARYPGGLVAPFQIVTTPGPGRAVDVRAWAVAGATASLVGQATVGADGGAHTALGDADNDGQLDLAVMPDSGAPTLLTLVSLGGGSTLSLPAGALGFTGGMRLAIGSLLPGVNDIVTVDGPGGLPRVQVFQLSPGGSGLQRLGFLALEVP